MFVHLHDIQEGSRICLVCVDQFLGMENAHLANALLLANFSGFESVSPPNMNQYWQIIASRWLLVQVSQKNELSEIYDFIWWIPAVFHEIVV